MKNEFDKKEIEINKTEKKLQLNQNSAMTSPFSESVHRDERVLEEIKEIKADLSEAISKNDIREIFDYFNIGVFINRDGTYGISEYRQPSFDITYSDIGIDEEKLIENIVKISGNADFRKSSLENFGKIKYIGGRVDFRNSKFKISMKMPEIRGKIIFYEKQTLVQSFLIGISSSIKSLFK